MTKTERKFLEATCEVLESRFPGVTAAFDGFVTPYLAPQNEGLLVVQVFNVPDELREEVLIAAEERLAEWVLAGGRLAIFSVWSPQETLAHFQADLAALRVTKGWLVAPGTLIQGLVQVSGRAPGHWTLADQSENAVGAPAWRLEAA